MSHHMVGIAPGIAVNPPTKPDTREIHFTKNFQGKASQWGLSEADALDVYHWGAPSKENMMVKKYNGYEIGVYYLKDKSTGQTVITSIWKRDRR